MRRNLAFTSLQIAIVQLLLLLLVLVHEGSEDLLLLGGVHLVETLRNRRVGLVLQLVRLFGKGLGGRRLRGLVTGLSRPRTLGLHMGELGLDEG